MTDQLAPERPPSAPPTLGQLDVTWLVVAAAAARGIAVAVSGLILSAGLALVLWAVTPASGAESGAALRGGIAAFAAANLMPISIGGVTLTLPPLLLTIAIAALLSTTARHGRYLPDGRNQETIAIVTTTAAYGLVVAAATRGYAPPGTVPAGWVWTAAALALVAVTAGTLRRGSAWRDWWTETAPQWARIGVRGGGIGLSMMIAGGALALSVALIINFVTIVGVSATAVPSWSDGLGMAFLGLAYLPNAVVAGVGYISGVGFEIGAGTYSPLSTVTVDLPAIPLLAAAPVQPGRSMIGIAFLIVPAIAAVLIARPATTHLATRFERTFAAALASVLTGALVTALAAIARGGVGNGDWSVIGSPPLLLGGVLTVEIGLIAVTVAALTGGRSVPWRAKPASDPRKPVRRPKRQGGRARTSPAAAAESLIEAPEDQAADALDDELDGDSAGEVDEVGQQAEIDDESDAAPGADADADSVLGEQDVNDEAVDTEAVNTEAVAVDAPAGTITPADGSPGPAADDDSESGMAGKAGHE